MKALQQVAFSIGSNQPSCYTDNRAVYYNYK